MRGNRSRISEFLAGRGARGVQSFLCGVVGCFTLLLTGFQLLRKWIAVRGTHVVVIGCLKDFHGIFEYVILECLPPTYWRAYLFIFFMQKTSRFILVLNYFNYKCPKLVTFLTVKCEGYRACLSKSPVGLKLCNNTSDKSLLADGLQMVNFNLISSFHSIVFAGFN